MNRKAMKTHVWAGTFKEAQAQRRKKEQGKKAANAKLQRQAAPRVERTVKAFKKQADKGSASPAEVNNQANKLRQKEKSRVVLQSQKNHKAARKQAWAGAANRATTSKNLVAIQEVQGKKPDRKNVRKTARDAILDKEAPSITEKVDKWYEAEKAKRGKRGKRPVKKEQRKKEQNRVLTQTQKDRKAERGKQWGEGKTPEKLVATKKPAIKLTKQERKNLKDRFQAARQKYAQTQGMPERGKTATVGTSTSIVTFSSLLYIDTLCVLSPRSSSNWSRGPTVRLQQLPSQQGSHWHAKNGTCT
jgi:hypothetical protein